MWPCPSEGQDPLRPTGTEAPVPPPGSLHKPLDQPNPLGEDNRNKRNYDPAAYGKETPNTVS